MADENGYVALDVSDLANTQADSIATITTPLGAPSPAMAPAVVGSLTMRGLPFRLGRVGAAAGEPDLAVFGGSAPSASAQPLSVAVGAAVRWLVFVHRLLDTRVYEGGPVGEIVAEYVVRYADGADEVIPIRERFEIAFSDERMTQLPFRGWWDAEWELPPRRTGEWDDAGLRQTELSFPGGPGWTLFPWRNPRPDTPIAILVIRPAGPLFAFGGVTLGLLDEHPLRPEGARDVMVTVDETADVGPVFGSSGGVVTDAASVADLRVSVDRGIAGFAYALPAASAEAFLADEVRGFGEPANRRPTPAVARVAALPSATVRVALGGNELAAVRWADLLRDGRASAGRVTIETLEEDRNWVRTAIVDDATGRPIPGRIHFRSPRGVPFQPHGHHSYVNSNNGSWHQDVGGDLRLGQMAYAYVDGSCEGWLPRGEVLVDVAQGFEYVPLRTRVTIEPGQRELTLRLHRWADANADGWFSGDTHVHFLSPTGGITEARGEGLNVVNVLQAQWGSLFTNTEDFTGEPFVHTSGRTIVYTSQENRQHVAGHMSLLGLRRPVMPWSSDGLGEGELGGFTETTMSSWADRAHEQGGTVVTPHFPSPNGETATLIATGRTDAVEMIRHGRYEHATWYRYLNAGYRLPLAGGTDKMSSDTPVGLYRTYVRLQPGEDFTYDAWCAGLRAGRTVHSGGPMLRLSVDGREVGDTVMLPPGGGTIEVAASSESIFPIGTLEIVRDGVVVASSDAVTQSDGRWRISLNARVAVDGHGWLAARVGGPGYWDGLRHRDSWARPIFAHTSPIYVAVGGEWRRHDEETAIYMLTLIDGALGYLRDVSNRSDAAITHHHGESDHLTFLERPHREAIAAIERRRRER